MADSNKARARKREIHLYLDPADAALLDRVVQAMGESVNTAVRLALLPWLRKQAKALGVTSHGARYDAVAQSVDKVLRRRKLIQPTR